jgi:hypothetical protein
MKYDVHVFRTVRMKVEDVEADSPVEAIKNAEQMEEFNTIRRWVDEVKNAEVMDDEGTTYYLVDPIMDNGEINEHSPDYRWRGPAPFYPESNTGAQSLVWDLFKEKKNWSKLKGMHPYMDLLLLEYKLQGDQPLDDDEFRRLPTLLNKDEWLDEKIKGRLKKGS